MRPRGPRGKNENHKQESILYTGKLNLMRKLNNNKTANSNNVALKQLQL